MKNGKAITLIIVAVVIGATSLTGTASAASAPSKLGRRILLGADMYRPNNPNGGVRPNGISDRSFTPADAGGSLQGTPTDTQILPGPAAAPGPGSSGDYDASAADPQQSGNTPQVATAPIERGQQQQVPDGGNRWGAGQGFNNNQGFGGQGFGNNQAPAGTDGLAVTPAGSQPWYNGTRGQNNGNWNGNAWNNGWNGNAWNNGWNGNGNSANGAANGVGTAGAGNPGGQGRWGVAPGNRDWRWGNNKGNKQSLNTLTGDINSYPTIRPQPIPVTGTAGTLSQGIRRRGNARAAAQSLAQAYSSGQADAAAQAMANAATVSDGAEASAVAEAVAETTINHPNVAPGLLAKSAGYAVTRGQTNKYADIMADAFMYARKKKHVPQFTTAVADAIATGGAPTRYAYGQAIATAIADGGEGQAAVAEATAAAFCAGDSTASAWASAYAVALSQDSRGCLVLNQAKAMAQAQCGNGATESFSKAEATSLVLGFCGRMDMIPGGLNYNWSGGNAGSSTESSNPAGGLSNNYYMSGR